MRDLKLVYQAVNKDAAEKAFDDLEIKRGEDYSIVIKSWRDNWDRLTAYFRYPLLRILDNSFSKHNRIYDISSCVLKSCSSEKFLIANK